MGSELIAQVMEAFAGLDRLDVDGVAELLKVVFASSVDPANEEADAVGTFVANLLDALSPPNRLRILRKASPRDLLRTQRYWRAGLLFLCRAERSATKGTHNVAFDERLMISVVAGGSGLFHLMLDVIVRGGAPRLRASFLLLAGRLRRVARGEDRDGEPLVELLAIWDEWQFGHRPRARR